MEESQGGGFGRVGEFWNTGRVKTEGVVREVPTRETP